jgi:hypothetical protein
MISTELDSRRAAAPDEWATLFPTGGACSSLATAVRLQRLDGLLNRDSPGPASALVTTRSTGLTGTLPPFDERSDRNGCQVDRTEPGRPASLPCRSIAEHEQSGAGRLLWCLTGRR